MSEREQDADGPQPPLAVPGHFAMCPRWALALRLVLSAVAVVAAVAMGVCAASSTSSRRRSVVTAAVAKGADVLTTRSRSPLKRSGLKDKHGAGGEAGEVDDDAGSEDGSELSHCSDVDEGCGCAYGFQCQKFEEAAAETEWWAGDRSGGGRPEALKCDQCPSCMKRAAVKRAKPRPGRSADARRTRATRWSRRRTPRR